MIILRRFLSLLVLILLFVFCVFNTQPVVVRFPGWEGPALPLFLPLLFAFSAGVILALLAQSLHSLRRRHDARKPTTPVPEKPAAPAADRPDGDLPDA